MEQKDIKQLKIKNDGQIAVATGKSRKETNWKNKTILWSQLVEKLSNTTRTPETVAEYKKMAKADKDEIKDVGGFVGGALKNGRRKAENVANRSMITLDMDNVKGAARDIWDAITMLDDYAIVMYSTHSHTPNNPRLRLVIPLSRPVLGDEYQAVARMIASDVGIDQFDDTTYEPHRLMYWPSTSADEEYLYEFQDGPFLDPDTVLNRYIDWKDVSYWPESSRQAVRINNLIKKQEDPLTKKGVIGAFCRAYTIPEAIEKFIPDVYIPTGKDDRYTYAEGSTVAGVIIYEDKFSFSHHGTDPASGMLCNAFDLIRIHKFSGRDEDAKPDTPVNKLPSFLAMSEFVSEDKRVKELTTKERLDEVMKDFDIDVEADEIDLSWTDKLKYSKGQLLNTIQNAYVILEHDQFLKGQLAYNDFSNRAIVTGRLPWNREANRDWKDEDDSGLRHYIEQTYGAISANKIYDALVLCFREHAFHPVKDYLNSLEWDGIARVDTLLSDYLGAQDYFYTRAVIRKHLAAAVARIMKPGIKFDTMLVLTGPQGLGKSSFIRMLGQEWYNDSLTTVSGKEAYEQLQGSWLMEMGELTATKKADIEAVKMFLSKCEDIYRVAYGKRTSRFPRQCVFFGTSNDREFLRDKTGNRRFWPVDVGIHDPKKDIFTDLEKERDHIWAEAKVIYERGEKLYLEGAELEEAAKQQEEHSEESSKTGLIMEYLDTFLPENWYELDMYERRNFIEGGEFSDSVEATMLRTKVSVIEIWCELFNGDPKQLTPLQSREINDILRSLKGWERCSSNLRFGEAYGTQRGYVRQQSF
jgi:putative DNA primase/helicase